MTEQKSTIPTEFERQARSSGWLDRAAMALFEASKLHLGDDLPQWWHDDVTDMRRDCKYRALAAYRRGIASCRMVSVERAALALALADGEQWPDCNRAINPQMPEAQRLAIAASRRQRYRHLASLVVAEVNRYLEMGVDTEEQRQAVVADVRAQRTRDEADAHAWRNRMPSAVSQLRKDEE